MLLCARAAFAAKQVHHTVGEGVRSVKLVKSYLPVTPRQKALWSPLLIKPH